MRNKTFLVLPIILLSVLTACQREQACANIDLNFRLIGFSDAEADTIILRRFQKNTSTLIDSFVFDPNDAIRFNRFGDTLVISSMPGTAALQSSNDYQFYFPGAARTIAVTGITQPQIFAKRRGKLLCGNPITGCKVDGQPVPIYFASFIYMKK